LDIQCTAFVQGVTLPGIAIEAGEEVDVMAHF